MARNDPKNEPDREPKNEPDREPVPTEESERRLAQDCELTLVLLLEMFDTCSEERRESDDGSVKDALDERRLDAGGGGWEGGREVEPAPR